MRSEITVLVLVLVALSAGMAGATHGLTARTANISNILLSSSIKGVASIGQAFVILTSGIDLSVGGLGLMVSILGASLMTSNMADNVAGFAMPMNVAIPIMLLTGAGIGFVNGSAVSRVGMPALIVTLGGWQILNGISYLLSEGTSISALPAGVGAFGVGTIGGVPNLVVIFIAVCAVAYFILHHTTFGRCIYAIGGSPESAWLSGIDVKRVRTMAYIISGLLAGLAGVMTLSRMAAASMQTLGGLELDSIAAVCVGGVSLAGGKGGVIGVIIGVLLISTVNNALAVLGADPAQINIVRGAIIIGAVAVDYVRRQRR